MNERRLAIPILLLPLACAATPRAAEHREEAPPWSAPPIERAVSVRDGRTGAVRSFDELLDELADADVVFLGETHTDEATHRVELAVYEGLLARQSGRVVLALEMFERDVQPVLDAYLAGEKSEPEFLAAARPWSNYPTGYRPLIELAKERRVPVIASNFPTPLRRRMAQEGNAILTGLEGPARGQAPQEFFANTPEYWRRVDNATRGHAANMPASAANADAERLYSTQSLWDNSMGESCALALDAHPGSSVLHVNGGFHSEYWDGTARQFALRKPAASIRTVAIVPTSNPTVADVGGKPVADFVVFAEARATDVNEGTYSVSVRRSIEYRLHLPAKRGDTAALPLLIWFADDGERSTDSLALLRKSIGDESAIAVIEAPYRETQDDLVEGGRWFWPDSFSSDIGTLAGAAEEVWAYALRHHPIDPARVCFGGEGTGATVASAVALLSDRASARTVAFSPRKFAKLKDIPLPLAELRGDAPAPAKSLHVVVDAADESWWSGELAEYAAIGLEGTVELATDDPWLRDGERESALRTALGLEPARLGADAPRRHIVVDGTRAQSWARLIAADQRAQDGALVAVLDASPTDVDSTIVEVDIVPEKLASGTGVPRCPGPFGGTSVIVLHESSSPEEIAAWVALEDADPLAKKSPFMRLRIAAGSGERSLPNVLTKLSNQGRKNVLIVPATFCADGETMRSLRRGVRDFEDQMTLHWRPGLGGALE